jgi:hypothetical protein
VQALAALRRADAVLGPARDGGFYLMGLRKPAGRRAQLFHGVDWGTARACRQALAQLRGAGLRVRMLPVESDVDRPEDVRRLKSVVRWSRRGRLAPLRRLFRLVLR